MSSVGWVFDLLRGKPKTPSAPTAGWRSPTTCVSSARGWSARSWCCVVAFVVALFFYDLLLDFIAKPYRDARRATLGEDKVEQPSWSPTASAPV